MENNRPVYVTQMFLSKYALSMVDVLCFRSVFHTKSAFDMKINKETQDKFLTTALEVPRVSRVALASAWKDWNASNADILKAQAASIT